MDRAGLWKVLRGKDKSRARPWVPTPFLLLPLSTHIRSRQIFFLSSLLPVATWSTCSLLSHHTLGG